ncbi:hypothetical protein BCV72DRAFT_312636 [Rhizopus microsporus var. microsporus]|uniref:Uncharacterized protein n=2 Tax=Rhizopus microsporus TaxID=58291 RepID=A0A2G4T4E1_RHIZD|nr:uncharacterized protein RHIMIDRAFT_300358 [Rhizopus microsporus ATCC 52813]ORE04532.1 hypothetical protein BCV72DRAFT_312636 [Rhizopus microsporus var. microsporus]PHZ15869.1 hypothetical protein RHIMIDRAFT_300358 [Rhizopus microsporus ATCC 52813]
MVCVYSPDKAENCGFRTISMVTFSDQNRWQEVKALMMKTYNKYKDTLYANRVDDGGSFEKGLSCNLSLCPVDYWFNTIDHPQIAADAFGRAIVAFSKTSVDDTPHIQSSLFVPFVTNPMNMAAISIFLCHSHFYLIQAATTKTGRQTKLPLPLINPYHKAAIKKFAAIYPIDFSITY